MTGWGAVLLKCPNLLLRVSWDGLGSLSLVVRALLSSALLQVSLPSLEDEAKGKSSNSMSDSRSPI